MTKPVASGKVELDGTDLTNAAPDAIHSAGIAAVTEGRGVLTRLSVNDFLRAAGSLLSANETASTLSSVYELFPDLAERKRQIAGTMSGGQQQMLAIGHALMCRPRYLLIDEMSLGLGRLLRTGSLQRFGNL